MSASATDKITDVRNAARPNSARVTVARSAAATSLSCNSLAGWPTASKVHFVTYEIDANSNPVAGTQIDCSGIVSGNTIGTLTVIDGTDSGNAVGDVVEMLPTAAWGQDLADALTVGHTRTGAHISALPLTSPILTTPVIADFTSANHTHATAAQGGKLTSAGITSFDTSLTTISNPYKFSAYRNAALTLSVAGARLVTYDTEFFDTNSNFDSVTNNNYTAPVAGFYKFDAHVSWGTVTSLTRAFMSIRKNSTEYNRGEDWQPNSLTAGSISGSWFIQLAANDTVDITVTPTGANLVVEVGASSPHATFTGYLVSQT